MANKKHLARLKKGVDAWNAWRGKNPDIRPDLNGANLSIAHLNGANLREANLRGANLSIAHLIGANFGGANLIRANLGLANLSGANLSGARLNGVNLRRASLTRANLSGANLRSATLVDTDLTDADLTGCHIYGVSAWGLKLNGAKQQNLVITHDNEPTVTVDSIEVAQFVYLLRPALRQEQDRGRCLDLPRTVSEAQACSRRERCGARSRRFG
jgi:hypothetical protein